MRPRPPDTHAREQDVRLTATRRIERIAGNRGPLLALVGLGIALRIWQYAFDATLWLDEIAFSRNILGLSLHDLLLRPLSYDQVAPRGFILVEKLMSLAFGPSELTLRFIPLVVSIAGVILFWRLAERMLDGVAVHFALFLYAIAIPLVKYAAEVKQYGLDAAVATVLVLLALDLRDREPTRRRLWLTGLAGFVLVWFSQTSVIVLGGLGVALGIEWLAARDRRTLLPVIITVPLWALGALLAVVAGMRSMTPSTQVFMYEFWSAGFLPWPIRPASGTSWLWTRLTELFGDRWLLRYPWPAIYVSLAALGTVALWRTRRDRALMLAGVFGMALVAAVLHQYPLFGRVAVYLIPFLLIAAAAGADWLRRAAGRYGASFGSAVMLACLVPPVSAVASAPPPYTTEDYRTVFAYLRDHRLPGDSVYVVGNAHSGAIFYGPRYGLARSDWRRGICDRNDARPFVRDVDRYRGVERLWVFSTGVRPLRVARESIRSYLGTIGTRRDSLFVPSLTLGPVALELYDLSDPNRLRAAQAESFPVQPMPTAPRPGCRDWSGPPGQ